VFRFPHVDLASFRLEGLREESRPVGAHQHRPTGVAQITASRRAITWSRGRHARSRKTRSSSADDLGWNEHEVVEEGAKIHSQDLLALSLVFVGPTTVGRQQQRKPGLETPRQGSHGHVGPVRRKGVERGVKRSHAVFELGDQVLLATALVRLGHDLSCGHLQVIGEVEEVANLVAQLELPSLFDEVLADDDHPIGFFFVLEGLYSNSAISSDSSRMLRYSRSTTIASFTRGSLR